MLKRIIHWIFILVFAGLVGCAETPDNSAGSSNSAVLNRIVAKGSLVMGTSGDMPPMTMTTKDKQVIGYDIDLGELIADSMGVKLEVKVMPFSELLPALQSGRVDLILSGMTITSRRNLNVAFSGPYMVSGKCILTKEETLANADEPSDINRADIKLAVLKGSTSEIFVETLIPDAQSIASENTNEAVDAVLKNKANALIADYPVCVVTMLRYPDQGLISVLSLLTQEPLGIALPADALLINWMDNFLHNMTLTGHLEELKSKWFEDDSWLAKLP
ncbi:MAG: transporter substrate-binding domain-containing protein [Methylococcaceae bacterium]|nr:transporter substrate-binding domain-containing protein [Methylococcaceae bacterium]MCI0666845.1 transporter substrate-binding domain-containing protein [Methylococcaceae bacterium]MCI0733944.1 transporter substrate-binding domain-containing protein [Methylococcaceae bacterium]